MRISVNWLHDLVDFDLTPNALAETLTLAGFEVEDIEDRRTWADGVVVGKILSAEPHPNASKLQVCQVDLGQPDPTTIVCGAANARAGLYVPVAVPGTFLPAINLKIEKADKRGVASAGMICSLSELGLVKSSDGIHEFPEEYPLGSDVRSLLGLDDVVLDLTSTANRADALSMVGIAREVAALTRNPVHLPMGEVVEYSSIPDLTLTFENAKHCPAYSGTLIQGVTIAPSPEWLKRRLEAAGTRSINNVVDITNFILLEWGQPLHAFDWQRLQTVIQQGNGSTVGVRLAKPGETLKTLDGSVRPLQTDNLVITAGDHPVALAGVMGGEETEVHTQSVDIFLEAALFDPVAIRRSARAQSLRTEASARYERGVDFSALTTAQDRAVQLILEWAGGSVVGQTIADQRPSLERVVTLRLSRLIDVLGDDVAVEDVTEILPALGFELSPCGTPASALTGNESESHNTSKCVWQVKVPPYRLRDVEREIDLIEEFARIYGYDRFASTLPPETIVGSIPLAERIQRQIREVFRSVGLTELVHSSLCATDPSVDVVIKNPLSPEFSALRKALLPGLVEAFRYNWDQGNGSLNGFEIGRIFFRHEEGYQEADHLGGILGGNPHRHDWQHHSQPYDWFAAKGVFVGALERLGVQAEFVPESSLPNLHPGRTAAVIINGSRLGWFGQLHPRWRRDLGLPDEVYAFELDLDALVRILSQQELTTYQTFSSYPASDRDIAFFAPVTIPVANLESTIQTAAGSLLETLTLFDDYRGEGVPAGERSLAFRLVYRAADHTLTDPEVEAVHQKVRTELAAAFGVNLRS